MTVRIHGGRFGSRTLKGPAGSERRPTRSRVREALFNILAPFLSGASVLDLYAGLGACGIEAASRGASQVVFVDSAKDAVQAIRSNAAAILPAGSYQILSLTVGEALGRLKAQGAAFDLVLADPPYQGGVAESVPLRVAEAGILRPHGRLVIEHDRECTLPLQADSLHRVDQRFYGRTGISIYGHRPPTGEEIASHG